MIDFKIWLVASLILIPIGCYYTFKKNTFTVEILNFIAFVSSIGYIILKRYTFWSWAVIPLVWLFGIMAAAVLLLISQSRNILQGKREADKKKY
jgi:hypothetical protein